MIINLDNTKGVIESWAAFYEQGVREGQEELRKVIDEASDSIKKEYETKLQNLRDENAELQYQLNTAIGNNATDMSGMTTTIQMQRSIIAKQEQTIKELREEIDRMDKQEQEDNSAATYIAEIASLKAELSKARNENAELNEELNELSKKAKHAKATQEGIAKAKAKRKEVDWGKVDALKTAGWPVAKIADEIGCSTQIIYNHYTREKKKAEG